ncbi:hypothetical protein TKK_0017116 [Trichogramma kaykai]|uniref:Endonuclease/exonuclease/phosphatase domain-containing protein n=1 Tax=Trichogramma kaykai TaxID=54128 RepID=A0ABD2W4E3_9HYME
MELKIALWNCNGLTQKQRVSELQSFLIINDIDIILLSETHFASKNFLSLPNYSFYCCNHPDNKAHGGSAILIKSSIKHCQDSKFCEDYLQATTIVTEEVRGKISFSALYFPPRHSISHEMYCTYFDRLGAHFVTGGDFNAKHPWWGSRLQVPNPEGCTLYSVIADRKYSTISPGEPTY